MLLLQKELKHFRQVRIGTVEEFQGEEKNVIIISAVKTSGKNRALEFIYCQKRLNTAISRARSVLIRVFITEQFINYMISFTVCWLSFLDGSRYWVTIKIGLI